MEDLAGKNFGRYKIIERLGEGGMATVYKAYDSMLEREVAIKIIRREAFPPEMLQDVLKRFEREAKSLARLSHPNIVKVLDFGEHEGSPFLVLEYLSGGTLKQRVGTAIPWQEAVRLLLPIARGIEYAHQRGVIHRDIKPANILMTEGGEPTLSDFGIAKLFGGEKTTNLTGSGMAIGTPEYMAPEQWTGNTGIQSDVYAVGVVLYELITGRKPYVADTPGGILVKQIVEPLPLPREFALDLPETVEAVLLKALAKEPKDRHADMRALIVVLENLLLNSLTQPVTARSSVQNQPEPLLPIKLPDSGDTVLPTRTLDTVTPTIKIRPEAVERKPTALPKFSRKGIFAGLGALIIVIAAIAGYPSLKKLFATVPPSTATITATNTMTLPLSPSFTSVKLLPSVTFTPSATPTQEKAQIATPPPTAQKIIFLNNERKDTNRSSLIYTYYTNIYVYDLSSKELSKLNDQELENIYPYWPPLDGKFPYTDNTFTSYGDIFINDLKANKQLNITGNPRHYGDLVLLPGGKDLSFNNCTDNFCSWGLIGIDGTNYRQFGSGGIVGYCSSWSVDGQQMVFLNSGDIWVVGQDAGKPINLTKNGSIQYSHCPQFSPVNASEVAVVLRPQPGQPRDIFLIDTATLSAAQLTEGVVPIGSENGELYWSPDGRYIALLVDNTLTVVNVSTGDFAKLTTPPIEFVFWTAQADALSWSPDGQTIAFISGNEIYTIRVDGSNLTQITDDEINKIAVAWLEP